MGAVLVDVAEAIKDEINSGTFTNWTVEAERSYADWDLELADMDQLRVDVVPVDYTEESKLEDRRSLEYYTECDIGIRYRFGGAEQDGGKIDLAEIDGLVLLVEEMAELTIDGLTGLAGAQWVSTSIRSAFIRRHLRELRQFTGLIRVTHYVEKSLD